MEIKRILEEDENYIPEQVEAVPEAEKPKKKKKKKVKSVPLLFVEHEPYFLGGGVNCCRKAQPAHQEKHPQHIGGVCVTLPDGRKKLDGGGASSASS
jgi:hypothetical protein